MRTRTTKAAVAVFATCLTVLSAFAETVTWTNQVTKSALWSAAGNWTNESGAAAVPASGDNVVVEALPALPAFNGGSAYADSKMRGTQTISTGTTTGKTGPEVNPVVGTMTGGEQRRTVKIDTATGYGGAVYFNDLPTLSDGFRARYFDVSNPNGFLGFWQSLGVMNRITTHPSGSFTPVFQNFYVGQRPVFDVPSDRVEIENAYGGNSFEKMGAGTLAVKSFNGQPTRAILKGGTLEIGSAPGALEAVLAKAAIWLDASDEKTLTQYSVADETRVSQWRDVRGGPDAGYHYAGDAKYKSSNVNFLTSSTNPVYRVNTPAGGLALLDFGDLVGTSSTRPGECLKIYPDKFTNVRAVFYAADCPKGAGNVAVIGDVNSYMYIPGGDTVLYDASYAAPAIRYADISLNMRKVSFGSDGDIARNDLINMHVVGHDTSGQDTKVGLLGSREYYRHTSGGARMGEVILFTNELTRAERMLVAAYLNDKWRAGAGSSDKDLDAVLATSATAANLAVPAGKVAKVGTVRSEKKSIVKSGEGRLEIGSVSPASTEYTVNAGELAITQPAVATDAPADGAALWLDATKLTGSLVNEWPDARTGVSKKGTTGWTDEGHVPRVIQSPLVGNKQVVDFGGWNESGSGYVEGQDAAWMKLPAYSQANYEGTYTYFCVLRVSEKSARKDSWAVYSGMPFIGSNGMAGYHDGSPIVSSNYRGVTVLSMQWHIDGVEIDPYTYDTFYNSNTATNTFRLVSFSSTVPLKIDRLCSERDGDSLKWRRGGLEIGEVLLYSRQLTADETRDTEAYLMKKWLGKEHPAAAKLTPAKVTFDTQMAATLETDADMSVATLVGGNGSVVKKGAGEVAVSSAAVAPKTISVAKGSLAVPVAGATFLDDAAFHFDASRPDTMTYTVDAQGNTNVTVWADVRGNGWTAEAEIDSLATQAPRLVTVETAPDSGRYIPALDFGAYSWRTNDYSSVNGSASMRFKQNGKLKSQNFREVFSIFADAEGCHQASMLGQSNGHDFQRDWENGKLARNVSTDAAGKAVSVLNCSGIVLNSRITIFDNQSGPPYYFTPSAGFHRLDYICATEGRKEEPGWAGQMVDAIAQVHGSAKANSGNWGYDYDLAWEDRGGTLVAEQFGFVNLLTFEQAAYVNKLLDYKWFGKEHPGYLATNTLDSVSVAAGASLRLLDPYGATLLKVKNMNGAGDIAVGSMQLTESLDVTVANGKTDCLAVKGNVVLDGPITVNVTADLSSGKIAAGLYPILEATSLTGFDGTAVTVNVLTEKSGISLASVVKQGNTLYLDVRKRGLVMIIQ